MKNKSFLHPINSVLYVSDKGVKKLEPEEISKKLIGEKAFGLSSLPKKWTLPFIVISKDLFTEYSHLHKKNKDKEQLLLFWCKNIKVALDTINISSTNIIIRSSGCTEGLEQRGKLHSYSSIPCKLMQSLDGCLKKLVSDEDTINEEIPLIIQKYIQVHSCKGHLSNERHCYKDTRDWLGVFEKTKYNDEENFQINLRKWREEIDINNYLDEELLCGFKKHIRTLLRIPATWATYQKLRIHFEWIWDGTEIFIVQADQELHNNGIIPKIFNDRQYTSLDFVPQCLKKLDSKTVYKYNKIHNVQIYKELNLPIANLYILDNQTIIKQLALGNIHPGLKDDITELVKNSLVIRMDIDTDRQEDKQLLPRTQEVRDLDNALKWLKCKSEIVKKITELDIAFIFHNFIPAHASAFAYAAPTERQVQIEALWGLPEGLYYFSHDQYVVDTKSINVEELDIDSFKAEKKINHKSNFVFPDKHGTWSSQILKTPYDWNNSIKREEWVKEIAFQSRRIANKENKPVSIMWFVDVPKKVCPKQLFPWHHEYFDPTNISRAQSKRSKSPYHKSFIIKTNQDVEKLRNELNKPSSKVGSVLIQPTEDSLLRNKKLLKEIGEITKKLNAVILMKGGILSHAFYQLIQTGATVEFLHPFDNFNFKQDFHKLVRDKVPGKITNGGEVVNIARLTGESLLKGLKDKLIEEAFEVYDAPDRETLISELTDVNEVIDEILSHLNITRDELILRQLSKRNKAGGFNDGIVLLDTDNPVILPVNNKALFENADISKPKSVVHEINYSDITTKKLPVYRDKKENSNKSEIILRLNIPMTRDEWSTAISALKICPNPYDKMELQISGKRKGAKYQIEVSLFNTKEEITQLTLDL